MEQNTQDSNYREYSNSEITVIWKPELCTHDTTCFVALPKVFNPRLRPWVNLNEAKTQKIIEIVNRCPSGALTFKWNNLVPPDEKKKADETIVEIIVTEKGPYIVNGSFVILDHEGKQFIKKAKVALCRCGKTHNVPFCDGQHRKLNF